ncbi:DUF1028 domain-containing protein [Pseudomonas sp. CGJS7]|uniref:DUF1028 domain-containing protein n=1 Tax=Pseudomonas sp. CGJS7 TaxID=3109348 RepID=UPI00300B68B1
MRIARRIASAFALSAALFAAPAGATYSIVACDGQGNCGAAVATHNLAVGASVIHARAKVGALATQFETNPNYGPKGLDLLAGGATAKDALQRLLDEDGGFEGGTIGERQVGLVDAGGHAAVYTGRDAQDSAWAGARAGEGYAVQGNGLASAQVLDAMERAYRRGRGELSERLMAALRAGQAAGGQRIGGLSAALRVATLEGGFQDIDLRVDGSADPVADLSRLHDQFRAHQAILAAQRAARRGDLVAARAQRSQALRLSHQWDRIWRSAARLTVAMGDRDRALEYLGVFAGINPVWARSEIDDDIYAPLRADPAFSRLRERIAENSPGD